MFTGIVQGTGCVQSIEIGPVVTMGIQIPSTDGLEIGASVSIDGVCLTATSVDEAVTFDIIPETLERTTLGSLSPGSSVNVERALKFGDELGGHLLSGHIMGTAEILTVENQDYTIKCSSEMAEFIQEKGFIAVDGISLTVGVTDGLGCFEVHIIPETLRLTTLGSKGIGDLVNIEIDAMTQAIVETTKRLMANKEV
ncbi:MAG: riboflavin synthase subunit alpha [Candidatus Thalassarchaeaceae archaeon]|jgi:riboflavin synthase|nr:riboflavin synthase subunit alpha [Candidatus Thalassarchaeaceae archaeon]